MHVHVPCRPKLRRTSSQDHTNLLSCCEERENLLEIFWTRSSQNPLPHIGPL